VDRLKAQTPEELHYLIKDLFEDITLFGNRTTEAIATKISDDEYRVRLVIECEKFKADPKGVEEQVEMDDWLEVGAFAEPEPGKRFGQLLHRERVQLKGGQHELEFTVKGKPHKAGVDPRNLLVDRVPSDNLKTVSLAN
jgi:hypothetical protein